MKSESFLKSEWVVKSGNSVNFDFFWGVKMPKVFNPLFLNLLGKRLLFYRREAFPFG